jgi:cob(I)alamin adenosyltransferase
MAKGLIHIYTGDGKGKTTAALGLALRACGHGLKVILIQFIKGSIAGEHTFTLEHESFKILKLNNDDCFKKPKQQQKEEAGEMLNISTRILTGQEYDIVILDEIFIAYNMRLITLDEIINLMDIKPSHMELIMTGRMAPAEAIERADLVTEMKMVKHPYSRGIKARPGIEY